MPTPYDALIIGAGLNALTAAAYLGRAGLRVLVLDQRDQIGGIAHTRRTAGGFLFDGPLHAPGEINPRLAADLDLAAHGLELIHPPVNAFTPHPDGRGLAIYPDVARTAESIRRYSSHDADRWPDFCQLVARITALIAEVYTLTPPSLAGGLSLAEFGPYTGVALKARGLPDRDLFEFMRVLPMSIAEWLDDWFESDALKALLAPAGVAHLNQGPMASGTAFLFLHHHVWNPPGAIRASSQVRGGMGKLAEALAESARAKGVEIRTGARVERVLIKDYHAVGAALVGGEEIAARAVISAADPRSTFLNLVEADWLDPDFVRRVKNYRMNGALARINLGLSALPDFRAAAGVTELLTGMISLSPSIMDIERSHDDAKYGRISASPLVEASLPSLADPARAPQGKHVMSLTAQYAPYHLRDGEWDDVARETLLDRVTDALEAHAPDIRAIIAEADVITPPDIERDYGLAEGHLYHGEMMLDQLFFMRPVPGMGQYRAPLDGLYLCGAGTHPGGGVVGGSGYNAAREIIRDLRAQR